MHPPTALSLSLAASDSLIDEDLDLNPTVLAPPSSILVRGRRLECAHCARCHDTPHRHGALPHQIADYGLGAIFTQFLIHGRSACRVGEALTSTMYPLRPVAVSANFFSSSLSSFEIVELLTLNFTVASAFTS